MLAMETIIAITNKPTKWWNYHENSHRSDVIWCEQTWKLYKIIYRLHFETFYINKKEKDGGDDEEKPTFIQNITNIWTYDKNTNNQMMYIYKYKWIDIIWNNSQTKRRDFLRNIFCPDLLCKPYHSSEVTVFKC